MTRKDRYLILTMLFVLLIGPMILGPLFYFALQPIWPVPFHRAMDRALLVSALAAMLMAWPRLTFATWWPRNQLAWKEGLLGLGIAIVSIQLIFGAALACRALTPADTPHIRQIILTAVAAALIVPFFEETLFRGFLQTELIGMTGQHGGWIAAAVIYALAHFIKVPTSFDHQPLHAWSGAVALAVAGTSLLHDFLGGRGLNLLIVGLILGGTFLRSGHLWFNYGLHGGWVISLMLLSGLTKPAALASQTYFGSDLLGSPLTTVVLVLLGWWLWRFYRSPFYTPETGADVP